MRIAVLENDIKTIRHYTKYFAFDRGFDKQYYHQWKATFSTEEWMTIIENHLDETIKRTIKDHEKNKGKSWYNPNPPLLNVVSSIYIEEGFFERLFDLVKLEKDLDKLLYYHSDLKKHYPDKLIELYLPAFELKGDYANNRSDYADLSKKMKKVMKELPQFRDRIVTVAKMLKLKYPRRPAMIDELNKII